MPNNEQPLVPSDVVQAIQDSVATEIFEVDGVKYFSRKVHPIDDQPLPATIELNTLAGLLDFYNQFDFEKHGPLTVHIVDEQTVRLLTGYEGRSRRRPIWAQASPISLPAHKFGIYLEIQDMIIYLQVGLVLSPAVKTIIDILSNIKIENVDEIMDDGFSQSVVVRKGVHTGQGVVIPNPVLLAPFRTFPEIDQPESRFVLRLQRRDGKLPLVALFDCGDAKWKLETIESIKQFFLGEISDVVIIG